MMVGEKPKPSHARAAYPLQSDLHMCTSDPRHVLSEPAAAPAPPEPAGLHSQKQSATEHFTKGLTRGFAQRLDSGPARVARRR